MPQHPAIVEQQSQLVSNGHSLPVLRQAKVTKHDVIADASARSSRTRGNRWSQELLLEPMNESFPASDKRGAATGTEHLLGPDTEHLLCPDF